MYKKLLVIVLVLLFAFPCVAGAAELTGKITQWKEGKEYPLAYATVIIGKNIWLDTKGYTDVVKGNVAAKTTTNEKGIYVLNVPPGSYTLILWKGHYVPADGIKVNVPGSYDGSISYDNQVGSSGRHGELRYGQ